MTHHQFNFKVNSNGDIDETLFQAEDAPNFKEAWIKFRRLHPKSKEPFSTNKLRYDVWMHHIREAEKRPKLETVVLDYRGIENVRRLYRVSNFDHFIKETKEVYIKIAKCFPGSRVYACGSRVRGDYIGTNRTLLDNMAINEAREAAGMRNRITPSDYDFWVDPGALQCGVLPPSADRCKLRIPEHEKVAIPMQFTDSNEAGN